MVVDDAELDPKRGREVGQQILNRTASFSSHLWQDCNVAYNPSPAEGGHSGPILSLLHAECNPLPRVPGPCIKRCRLNCGSQSTRNENSPALALSVGTGSAPSIQQSPQAYFNRGFSDGHLERPGLVSSSSACIDAKFLCEKGQLDRALDVLLLMDKESIVPSVDMYRSFLKACTTRKALAQAKKVHAHLVKHRLESVTLLGEHVVNTLVKCGGLKDALQVFHRLPHRTVYSWTSVISGQAMSCQCEQALSMYKLMQQEGVQPNAYTFISLLKACARLGDLEEGRRIHYEALKHDCDSDSFVLTCLIDMYGKCGSIMDARGVFDGLPELNVVSFNAMLAAYAQQAQAEKVLELYELMWGEGLSPDARTFVSVLQACGILAEKEGHVKGQSFPGKSLEKGKLIHALAQKMGYTSNMFVVSSLVNMYKKCGSMVDARYLFDNLSYRDVVSWTAMLMAYVEQGQPEEALELYAQMWVEGVSPDSWTFVSVLKACSIVAEKEDHADVDGNFIKLRSLELGKVIHAVTWKKGYTSHGFVGNTLLTMYAKCGSAVDVWNIFYGLPQRDVGLWTAMITGQIDQGRAEEAFELYEQMRELGVSPNDRGFVNLLQACGMFAEKEEHVELDNHAIKVKSLERVRAIHGDIWRKGYQTDAFIGSTLVTMYGKCGSVGDAQNVFDELAWSSVVLWNAMLAVLVQQGQSDKALQLYGHMCDEGISRNVRTFVSILQACSTLAEREEYAVVDGRHLKVKALKQGKAAHNDASTSGCDFDVFVGSTLVSMYWNCGSSVDAQSVFDKLPKRDVVVWNVMLAAHVEQGEAEKVLQLYGQMQLEGVSPNDRSFVSVLQACSMLAESEDDFKRNGQPIKAMSLRKGKAVHADATSKGYGSDVFVGSALIGMYGKCGSLVDAHNVFDRLCQRDVISWTAILATYVLHGQAEKALGMYNEMHEAGVKLIGRTIVIALQACGMIAEKTRAQSEQQIAKQRTLELGREIHSTALSNGLESDVFVGNTLVSMYGKCGSIVDAQKVFDRLSHRDLVSWNALLAAYVQHGKAAKALQLYEEMWEKGDSPDARTFVSALQACGMIADEEEAIVMDGRSTKLKSLKQGRAIHDDIQTKGYAAHVFVGNSLISMYGKCGGIVDAQNVFDGLSQRDVVSWSAMLAAYIELGEAQKALQLFEQMQKAGVTPDDRTFVPALQACGILAEQEDATVHGGSAKQKFLDKGKAIHAYVKSAGYVSDMFIGNTLVSMYGKCGSMKDAQDMFDRLAKRSVVSWNSLLAGYLQQSQGEKVLQLYGQMQEEGTSPDAITLVCLLQVSSSTGGLDSCREIHHRLVTCGKNLLSPFVANTLIHAYGRCGSMVEAQNVFDALLQPDVAAWNALIAGYARQGNCAASLHRYEEMQSVGVKVNGVTYLAVLTACTHAGLVDKGVEYFESMSTEHGITPRMEHYACMVDLFGRAGYFTKVQDLLSTMPMQPDLAMWLCLMGACRKHGEVSLGRQAFDSALGIQPKHAAAYLLMSNIYADAGLWDSVREVKEMREQEGAWKQPGQSWMEDQQGLHSFVVGDLSHPWQDNVYGLMDTVHGMLEVPNMHYPTGCRNRIGSFN